jgi:uncharacterized protein (TIGR02217 family)
MTNSFDPVLFPPGYAYGFAGGPAHDTRIVKMDGGGEQRVQVREEPVWRWSAIRKNFRDADVRGLRNWVLARKGALFGWLFLDPADFSTNPNDDRGLPTAIDQVIGYGDGVTTRFKLRKQYSDPGGMTARNFPRRVVALTGAATGPVARVIGRNEGDDISPAFAVDGLVDAGAVLLPMSMEVQYSTPPSIGTQLTWGGYFVVPVRFGETTDQGLDAAIKGFATDEAPFDIESIPFDDPVPLVPGGSPYGAKVLEDHAQDFELSGRAAFYWEVEALVAVNGWLDALDNYPTGGPHVLVSNTGTSPITVRDRLGVSVGTVASGSRAELFVKEDGAGNRVPVLI